MVQKSIKIQTAVLWTAVYFGVMLFYTFLDITIWRNVVPTYAQWINLIVLMVCFCGFFQLMKRRRPLQIFSHITITGVLLAAACAVLFYLLMDLCLDPIWESLFPQSEQEYQDMMDGLIQSPVTSLLQVCVAAPVIEESLMRGFVLGGLKDTYGAGTALLVSSLLFAVLHFNMVQTLSALGCGLLLGLLYLKTNSVFCCILAHSGYNLISYLTTIASYVDEVAG